MADFLHLILSVLGRVSPVKIVPQWCSGLYMVAGKHRGTVGPGLKLVVPGLCDVVEISLVPRIEQTPRQSVTLRDGRHLTFTASLTLQVEDPAAAWLTVEKWQETCVELAAGQLAELLAEADPERFDPARGKRGRLLDEFRDELDGLTRAYGVRVRAVRFQDFVIGARPVRLLLDRPTGLAPAGGG